MLKVFVWRVSNDNRFIQNAVTVLKIQHGGIEIVGSSTSADIGKVDWGGRMIFSLSSAQKDSA